MGFNGIIIHFLWNLPSGKATIFDFQGLEGVKPSWFWMRLEIGVLLFFNVYAFWRVLAEEQVLLCSTPSSFVIPELVHISSVLRMTKPKQMPSSRKSWIIPIWSMYRIFTGIYHQKYPVMKVNWSQHHGSHLGYGRNIIHLPHFSWTHWHLFQPVLSILHMYINQEKSHTHTTTSWCTYVYIIYIDVYIYNFDS